MHSFNLLVITSFSSLIIFFFKFNKINKLIYLSFFVGLIISLYIYGNYEINKNKEFIKQNDQTIFVKIVSPNSDLKYGLSEQEIREKLEKLVKYSDPDKEKKLCLFGRREFLVDIVLTR